MKITGIEPILAGGRYLFVKVHTDEGLIRRPRSAF